MSSCSSLSSFPPELLLKIFQSFCYHCYDGSQSLTYSQATSQGNARATLRSLSLTSKQMSAMAAPILYHSLPPLSVTQACRLLSNIISKPHLGDSIYSAMMESTSWYAERTLGQQRLLNTLLERLELDGWDPYSSNDSDNDSDGPDLGDEGDVGHDDEDGGEEANDDVTPVLDEEARAADEENIAKFYCAMMRELVTRARNIQELEITGTMAEEADDRDDRWAPDEYEDEAWQRLIADPTALAKLRRLTINHWDSEGGFTLSDTEPSLPSLVLEAAGHLERLEVQKCRGISFNRTFPSITAVDLCCSYFTDGDLAKLIVCLPALRNFRYNSGGVMVTDESEEHMSTDIARHLGPRRWTLTSVSLCYSGSFMPTLYETLLDSFWGFPVLESMDLWEGDLFDKSVYPPPTNRLVSLLPRSLKRLRINGNCSARECQSLAMAVAAGQFPVLEEVTFGRVLGRPAESQRSRPTRTDMDFWIPISDAFRSLKIKCSLGEQALVSSEMGW